VEGKIKFIRDQRTKKQENKGTAKSCETRKVTYSIPADMLVDI